MLKLALIVAAYSMFLVGAYGTECVEDIITTVSVATTSDQITTVKTKAGHEFKIGERDADDGALDELQSLRGLDAPILICTDDGKKVSLRFQYLATSARKVD